MTVGNNIRRARADVKQAALAYKIGVDISTVSRWENNKNVPNSKMLQKIADALGVSTAFLLGEEDNANLQDSANNLQYQKATHSQSDSNKLIFKDGEYEVSVPDTEENRQEFWSVVKQTFRASSKIALNIRDGQKNQYRVGDITLQEGKNADT